MHCIAVALHCSLVLRVEAKGGSEKYEAHSTLCLLYTLFMYLYLCTFIYGRLFMSLSFSLSGVVCRFCRLLFSLGQHMTAMLCSSGAKPMLCSTARVALQTQATCTWYRHCLGVKLLPSVDPANHSSNLGGDSVATVSPA